MILHLALFTWTDEVTDDDVAALTAALQAMAGQIPELASYECGPALRLRPGADYGVAALVADEAALAAYLDSEAHARVYREHLGRMIATRSAVQIEVPETARP